MPITPQTPEKEYEKNPDIRKEDIAQLKEWMDKNPYLPTLPELELIAFYHSCQNSMELTKSVIDINYTLRTHMEEFKNGDPSSDKAMYTLERVLIAPLEQRTPEGYKVIYCRLLDYEPSHFHFDDATKNFSFLSDLLQLEDGTYPGVVVIIDMDKVVFSHITRLSVMSLKKALYFLQEALPVRLKGFHFANAPTFMDKLMTMLNPFIKKSFAEMVYIHPAPIDSLYKHVPKSALPKEMGGDFDSYTKMRDDLIAKLLDNKQYLIDETKKRIDESKRPGKPKNVGEIFGVEGSFKKLNLD